MNLHDLPPGCDDPVEAMFGFHRRTERQLASLGRLPARLETDGLDAESIHAAHAIIECLGPAAQLHHADEEQDLLPLLERRLPEAERAAFENVRARLGADHRELEHAWRAVRKPLQALAEGVTRPLPNHAVACFRALCATHISYEESALHLLTVRYLRREDRVWLALRVRERRVTRSSSG